MNWLREQSVDFARAVILCDSQGAIVAQCYNRIWGNERDDTLAKEGSQMPKPDVPISFVAARMLIKEAVNIKQRQDHEVKAEGKCWASLLGGADRVPPDLPRQQSVAAFRHITGHENLTAHLHHIRRSDPFCSLCQSLTNHDK
ncbi:hypothetical protein GE061_007727 [Apolygus lucorum]|uniref:Uncharacterized protein n=1 Tax=Apolygus lucorum TaxID=248454 RepID=A0A8S9WM64_APOLU|nr:hypothetical protein GE061_007727 [Apolygus lucorum]